MSREAHFLAQDIRNVCVYLERRPLGTIWPLGMMQIAAALVPNQVKLHLPEFQLFKVVFKSSAYFPRCLSHNRLGLTHS